MLRDKVNTMLVEYAEGTLDASQKRVVEEELKDSPELRHDLQLIRETFDQLYVLEDQEIPSHYFSNFLPRLHEKLEQRRENIFASAPLWLRRVLVPAAAAVLAAGGISLYYFQSAESHETLYEIAREINRAELDDTSSDNPLIDSEALFTSTVEDVVEDAIIESDFGKKILVSDVLTSNAIDENVINDGQIIFQLNDDEIEMILNRLNSNSVH